ncbi:PREDICTED: uncharacterized protein LOC108557794 [Nicrophorus vespilloides]|uniref:Uncharacterized protein LOC108557794 n=1 Tax=Nicrophorus vespilloides TaxID=110193 RepID=A0ABM1M5U3_NICVS|nr:PREDICTED: uncharacterized protein LOC108557794 [Nicrophorus vespilloides]
MKAQMLNTLQVLVVLGWIITMVTAANIRECVVATDCKDKRYDCVRFICTCLPQYRSGEDDCQEVTIQVDAPETTNKTNVVGVRLRYLSKKYQSSLSESDTFIITAWVMLTAYIPLLICFCCLLSNNCYNECFGCPNAADLE